MKFSAVAGDISAAATEAIVVNLVEGVTRPGGATGAVDAALGGAITDLIADGEIAGKRHETTIIHTLGRLPAKRVVVAGLGKSKALDAAGVRSVSGTAARRLRDIGVSRFSTIAHGAGIGNLDAATSAQAVAEGTSLGLYEFNKYKTPVDDPKAVHEVTIVEFDAAKLDSVRSGAERGAAVADAVRACRDMVNEPGNHMTPTRMAERAQQVANDGGLELEVLERPQMEELGMGALLGVAQGSREPPKLISLRYLGDPDNPDNNLALLGKGITFDSGGISLKPAAKMGDMKQDMAGGAAVISAMSLIAQARPRINVHGIIAATENMPGGGAQRPGDIVRAMNGKTIEIDNTDAEGRLVLADAASYAVSLGAQRIVDVATLTGAMSIALGHEYSGLFGNDERLLRQVREAGDMAGEALWQLPTTDAFKKQYRSSVADLKNVGGRPAGSITGALIIGEFVGDAAWAHVDIAGTAYAEKTEGCVVAGATGAMVKTLATLAEVAARRNDD